MKQISFHLYILAFLSIQLFISCKKAPPSQNEKPEFIIKFSRHALEYVHLTEGKYLIYKDSLTAQVDSIVVTKSKLDSIFHQKRDAADLSQWGLGYNAASPAYSNEQFTLEFTEFDGASSYSWLYAWTQAGLPSPWVSTDTVALKFSVLGNFPFPDAFYMTESMTLNYSMIVEGVQYNNVLVISHDNGNHPGDWNYSKATYYWAKNAGLIKYELIEYGVPVKTYTLLRHN